MKCETDRKILQPVVWLRPLIRVGVLSLVSLYFEGADVRLKFMSLWLLWFCLITWLNGRSMRMM